MSCQINEYTSFKRPRAIVKNIYANLQHEGEGATIRRSIGRPELKNLDPFLLLDDFSVSFPAGFPDHPHRGFESLTYMIEGSLSHQDFSGHKSTIRTGDVQWITAGRGIVHSEMPGPEAINKGIQIWISLPSKNKMVEPKYKEIESKDVPKTEKDGVHATVIAGSALDVHSPTYTCTSTMFIDFSMNPGSQLHQYIPDSWTAFVYVVEGEGVFGSVSSDSVSSNHVLVLGEGDGVSVWNRSVNQLRFILVGGQPLDEVIVQRGPFVMNTEDEIEQAFADYQLGQNGFEKIKEVKAGC